MDERKLRSITDQVTTKLRPSHVNVLDYSPFSARIQIVSESFENTTLTARFDQLYELLYHQSAVPRTFALQLEAWTPKEFAQLKEKVPSEDGSSGSGESGSTKKAAKPREDLNPIS